jgi:hypothetical protein
VTYSRSTKDLDGDEVGLLGNPVSYTTDGTSDVGTVTNIVNVRTTSKVLAEGGTTAKLPMVDIDARVNDIAIGASTSGGVVVVGVGSIIALRNAAETPCAACL